MWIIATIIVAVGVILDVLDYLFYDPLGSIGFERQRGLVGRAGCVVAFAGAAWLVGTALCR